MPSNSPPDHTHVTLAIDDKDQVCVGYLDTDTSTGTDTKEIKWQLVQRVDE